MGKFLRSLFLRGSKTRPHCFQRINVYDLLLERVEGSEADFSATGFVFIPSISSFVLILH